MSWLKVTGQFLAVLAVFYVAYLALYAFVFPKPIQKPSERSPLIVLINEARAEKDVAPLAADPTLDNTALIKANDMAAKNYFEHDAPDGTPWTDFIIKNRPGSDGIAENLAECYPTNSETMTGWINSPLHYANIVNPEWTKYGTATVYDEDRSCYVTVNHFAR